MADDFDQFDASFEPLDVASDAHVNHTDFDDEDFAALDDVEVKATTTEQTKQPQRDQPKQQQGTISPPTNEQPTHSNSNDFAVVPQSPPSTPTTPTASSATPLAKTAKNRFSVLESSASGSTTFLNMAEDGNEQEAESDITVESLGPADRIGWLTKYSGQLSAKKAWRKRYFVLKGNNLYFFLSPTSKSVGVLRMQGYKIDSADSETGKLNSIQATKIPNKLHFFVAESFEEKQAWMRDIYLASVLPTDDFSRQGINPNKTTAKPKKKDDGGSKKLQIKTSDPKEMEIQLSKEPGMALGLDIRVNLTEGTTISKIIPNGAAERCGQLRPGDRIVKINEMSIIGWTTENVVSKMRSLIGDIKFTIHRLDT